MLARLSMLVLLVTTAACADPVPTPKPDALPTIQQLQHQLRVDEALIQQLQQQNANQSLYINRLLAEQAVAAQEQKK